MKKTINIVSGLPRSGTSLMMKMLENGGLEIVKDDIRKPDENNPNGYYEFELVKTLPDNTEWLENCKGKCVKILAELITLLPPEHEYKIVFMERDLYEIIESQNKMLKSYGKFDCIEKEKIFLILEEYKNYLFEILSKQNNVKVLYINYNDLLQNADIVNKINLFFDKSLNTANMKNAIDLKLYRNKRNDKND